MHYNSIIILHVLHDMCDVDQLILGPNIPTSYSKNESPPLLSHSIRSTSAGGGGDDDDPTLSEYPYIPPYTYSSYVCSK